MNKIQRLRKALDFLSFKGFDNIEKMEIKVESESISLQIYSYQIHASELRLAKKLFGPLKAGGSASWRYLQGERKIDDEMTITFKLLEAYTCKKLDPAEMTEDKWEEIREKFNRGDIELQDCDPRDPKPDEDKEGEGF